MRGSPRWRTSPGAPLTSVGQIASAVAPFLGSIQAKILIGAAILGGALVSALVVSVAGSWGLAELLGWKHSLNTPPGPDSAKFYLTYAAAHIAGAALVLFSIDLVGLAVDVEGSCRAIAESTSCTCRGGTLWWARRAAG